MPKLKDAIDVIDSRICGIPCKIAVTYLEPYDPGCTSGPADNWRPPEGGVAEYRILDSKGYIAEWLERKITPNMEDDLQTEIFEYYQSQASKYDYCDDCDDYNDPYYY